MTGHLYTITRVFSNNVVLVREAEGDEVILLGKGIGFGRKSGEVLPADDSRIEKRFRLESESHVKQYRRLINEVDQAILGIAEEIIAMIAETAPAVNEHVHIALPDHIQFALERLRNGLEIVNPFLWEIQAMYPREYALARRAAEMISQQFDLAIPESEVGFLALHIHSAASTVPLSQTVRFARLVQELVAELEQSANIRLDRDDIDYLRLVTHLRFAVERIRQGRCIENPLLDGVKASCPDAWRLAKRLGGLIGERLDTDVPEDEVGYIALHVHRLLTFADEHSKPKTQ